MRKMIAGLAAGVLLAMGSAANAECVNCDEYDMEVSINGNPFFGKWTMVDDRPYLGIEALSDALNMPRKHNFKAWNLGRKGMSAGDPLMLMTQTRNSKVKTIRFGGVTMVDLYGVSASLGLPVHHNFRSKTIQVGDNYNGEIMKGKWYRYMARQRGWRIQTDLRRLAKNRLVDNPKSGNRLFDDVPGRKPKRL